jgi:iron-sulfur cluster repair protein YtfE (RIC family)
MNAPANLPSLFGRFTAILKDHEHLGITLKQLRAMCAALETAEEIPLTVSPPRLLEDLRADLSGHFAAEEAESYFGTIIEEAPPLAPRIDQLKHEHAAMLQALAALCEVAIDVTRALELSQSTRVLIAELERHERAESLLLRELFAP